MSDYGIMLIDKPVGPTSFQIIRQLRKITSIKKIGHTGTLDPFASGLLPLCIGKATRLAKYLSSEDKEYLVTMRLGQKTDTGDLTGEVIAEQAISDISEEMIRNIIPDILEISEQVPPKFSAIKVDGKRAYELARKNQEVKLKSRNIKIYDFKIHEINLPEIVYSTTVSKGTYIRVLSEQIAEMLGNVATTIELRRTAIDTLHIDLAVQLEDLTPENWKEFLLPIEKVLPQFPQITISQIEEFKHGVQFPVEHADVQEIMVLNEEGQGIGFADIENGILQPKLVLI